MCFRNELAATVKSQQFPRSPQQHYVEPRRPTLPRWIVPSTRVNLNAYWSKFEELSKQFPSLFTYDFPDLVNWSDTASSLNYEENEINDNLINELMELGNK